MKRIAILGSTGSVGRSVIDVVRNLGEYRVKSLSAKSNWESLAKQAAEFAPEKVCIADEQCAGKLRKALADAMGGNRPKVLAGPDGLVELAADRNVDVVVLAVMGGAGLPAAVAAVKTKKIVAIANKEPLVMAGSILMSLAKRSGAIVLPVDSEHSALFQAMRAGKREEIRKVIITASGGPFYEFSQWQLARVTKEQALRHPTWAMGPKITIDSATFMNKAQEIIEARWLFDLDVSQIEVLIHPQVIVHSMVEFCDGSVIAQLGPPDMRLPIQFALTFPERKCCPAQTFDLTEIRELEFLPATPEKYPALGLGYWAAEAGGTMGAALTAANEAAVDAFLNDRIKFTDIVHIVEAVMKTHSNKSDPTLDDVFEAAGHAKEQARRWILRRS